MNDNTAQPVPGKHPDDLPGRFSIATACAAFFFYLFLSGCPITIPCGEVMTVGILLFYGFYSYDENELGLGRPIPRGAKKAMIIIAGATLALLVIIVFVFGWVKMQSLTDPNSAFFPPERAPLRSVPGWAPDEGCYSALADMNVSQSALCLWQPFIKLVFSAPMGESVIIFAVLYPALYRRFGYRKSLFVTPLLFMALHLPNGPGPLAVILVGGFCYCFLYTKTRSLYPIIVMHACWNLIIFSLTVVVNWGLPAGR